MVDIKQQQIACPSWGFDIDRVERFAFWEDAFDPEECDAIVKYGKSFQLRKAAILNSDNDSKETDGYRKSEIVFLAPADDITWCYKRLTDIILELNNSFFGFDIFGFTENLQFTEYNAPAGHYDSHIDKVYGGQIRKLSFVLQLSDPSEYEGGELRIINSNEHDIMKKKKGTLSIFPSYTLHQVTPVTKGTRHSLVGWVSGKPFR